jgi:hypothetical protein
MHNYERDFNLTKIVLLSYQLHIPGKYKHAHNKTKAQVQKYKCDK